MTAVREMLRERQLVAVRRGENNALYLPADMLMEVEGELAPVPTLQGTLTLLGDAGFTDDAAMEWLLAEEPELRQVPLDALRQGRIKPVRRVAQQLF